MLVRMGTTSVLERTNDIEVLSYCDELHKNQQKSIAPIE